METINQRFSAFSKEYPSLSDYVNLSMSVRGMKYGKQKIYDAFNKFVPKGDYLSEEKDMLMDNLVEITNSNTSCPIPRLNKATDKLDN